MTYIQQAQQGFAQIPDERKQQLRKMALFIRTKIKSGEKVQLIFITCSQADKSCPLVPGATLRSAIPYEDPQEADGTSEEAVCYDERSRQIATKMLYCFSQINGLSDSPA